MNETKDVLIRVSSNSRQEGVCRGCKKPILWMETLNGKRMPMNSHAMPRSIGDGYDMYAAADSHWTTCSERKRFSNG